MNLALPNLSELKTSDFCSHIILQNSLKVGDNVSSDADNQQGRKLTRQDLTEEIFRREYCENLLTQVEMARKYHTIVDTIIVLRRLYGVAVIRDRVFRRRAYLRFTPIEKEVLLGTLCGDGYINKDPGGSCRFELLHCVGQLEYLKCIATILRRWLSHDALVKFDSYNSPDNPDRVFGACEIYTIVAPAFNELRELFYPDGKKVISRKVLDQLSARSLAFWFMDDGSGSTTQLMIHAKWSESERRDILAWFADVWSLYPKMDDRLVDSGCWDLRFSVSDSRSLSKIILPYMHPSMMYKLAHINLPPSETER